MGRGARGDGRYRGQGHSQCACVIITLSDFLCARKVVSSATFLSFISSALPSGAFVVRLLPSRWPKGSQQTSRQPCSLTSQPWRPSSKGYLSVSCKPAPVAPRKANLTRESEPRTRVSRTDSSTPIVPFSTILRCDTKKEREWHAI